MRRILLFITVLFSLHCLAQTTEKSFTSPEEAEKIWAEVIALHEKGQFDQLIPLLEPYRNYYKKHLPQELGTYTIISQALGHAYLQMWKNHEAENLLLECENLLKKDYEDTPIYRQFLSDLGHLYSNLRNYNKADVYYSTSKYLFEKNLDLGIEYAKLLTSYSIVQKALGNDLWAKMMVDLAKEISLETNDAGNSGYAVILSNLAIVYMDLGYYDEALENMLKAKEIQDTEKNVYNNAVILNNLAIIYEKKKDIRKAISYYKEAYKSCQTIREKIIVGKELAMTLFSSNDKESLLIASETSKDVIDDVTSVFTFLSDEERELFWSDSNRELEVFNRIFANSNKEYYYDYIYDNSIFSKGLLLKTSNLIKNEIYNSGDKGSIALLNKKLEFESCIEQGKIQEDTLRMIKDSINVYDKMLASRSSGYASFKKELTAKWSDIRKSLDKDEVAIEFVAIPLIVNDTIKSTDQYYALLLKSDSKHPQLVPLCFDYELRELISKKSETRLETFVKNLYPIDNTNLVLGNKLYDYIWAPIEKELKGEKTIYYSPIGQLNSVSFNAISYESTCLSEKYDLHLLSSTSEIIKIKQKGQTKITDAVVYGGISYDTGTDEMIAESRGYNIKREATRSIESDSTRNGWRYLEGTAKEASNINSILQKANVKTKFLTNNKANEESIKALNNVSPSLLHIATHGFFLSDPIQLELNAFINKKYKIEDVSLLMRSGLLFAGANRAWLGEDLVEGIEDGILTAEEISKLNLSKTKIVVLSACETGLGEVVSTEGVFGLQRAFKLAGVQTLIMSLWKVPDMATSKLMIEFYNNWISGLEVHQAFQKAQQLIKKEYPSPYYWAGFVMLD